MGRGPLFLAGLFALLVPGTANGATVAVETEVSGGTKGPDVITHPLRFKAVAGETNFVHITIGTTVIVRDDGASLVAGSGCTQAGPNEVTCAGADSGNVTLDDGNDRVEVAGA